MAQIPVMNATLIALLAKLLPLNVFLVEVIYFSIQQNVIQVVRMENVNLNIFIRILIIYLS